MDAEPDRPSGRFRQAWLRFRYAEHLGTRLTRSDVRAHIPLVLLNVGGACLSGSFFVSSIAGEDLVGSIVSALLFLTLMLIATMSLRMLIGYYRTDRYSIALDLWSDSGADATDDTNGSPASRAVLWTERGLDLSGKSKWPLILERIADGIVIAVLWVGALTVWIINLAFLYVMITGDVLHLD